MFPPTSELTSKEEMLMNMENLNRPFFQAIDISKRPTDATI